MLPSRATLVLASSLSTGLLLYGCSQSASLPPSASIPTPAYRPSPTPYFGHATPPTSPALLPKIPESNPWRPSVAAREWKYIVIHHTATENGSVDSIDAEHRRKKDGNGNPWLGIGYHFVIGNGEGMGDGEIEPTFRWREQLHGAHAGAGNKDYNQHGVGVCLVGNFENGPPSPAQAAAVKRLVNTLKREYHISSSNVVGHRDIRSTECPGKHFPMAEVAGDDSHLPTYSQGPGGTAAARLTQAPGSPQR